MNPESFAPHGPDRQPDSSPRPGPGYRGAKSELIRIHGLAEATVEQAMQRAATTPGQLVTVAEQGGYLYQVMAGADKADDSYRVITSPIH